MTVKMHRMEEESDEMSRLRETVDRYQSTQADHITAREALYAAIRARLAAGIPIGQVARESRFDREHVRRIRDGEQ